MKKENATILLKEMILAKEAEQDLARKLLKIDLNLLHESARPINILKNTIKQIVESPGITSSVLDTSLGVAAGYLSKKIIIGSSHNPILKIVGSILQFGISTIIMKNPETIKSFGGQIIKKIFSKKELDPEKTT